MVAFLYALYGYFHWCHFHFWVILWFTTAWFLRFPTTHTTTLLHRLHRRTHSCTHPAGWFCTYHLPACASFHCGSWFSTRRTYAHTFCSLVALRCSIEPTYISGSYAPRCTFPTLPLTAFWFLFVFTPRVFALYVTRGLVARGSRAIAHHHYRTVLHAPPHLGSRRELRCAF